VSAVVLRCPNCGTTRGVPGECDACHEAPVRYYCTQHRPGVWLDGPTCGQCGSRFAATPAPAPAPAPAKPAVRRSPALPPTAGRGPTPTRGTAPLPGGAPKPRGPRVPPLAASFETLDELIRGARPPLRPPPDASAEPGLVRNMPSVGGCLMRLVFLVILLFVFGIASLLLFGTASLRMFGFY
jgi:hypothetical protein